ncbi:MAG: helix-turn-helix domain-containing protein [Chitinophagaceae bacterium]
MEVICLEDNAFYALIDRVVDRIKEKNDLREDKWISGEEAMQKLRITSKTTLQKLRDEGKIRFSQPEKKIILYDADSINQYLEANSKDTFNHGRAR